MSEMTSSERYGQTVQPSESGRGGVSPWPSSGLLLTGLAVVGLGWLAWNWIGPDLIRYMKIRNM